MVRINNDNPDPQEYSIVKVRDCEVLCDDVATVFETPFAGSPEQIQIEFSNSKIAAQAQSHFGQSSLDVTSSRLHLEGCECSFGFEYRGSAGDTVYIDRCGFNSDAADSFGIATNVAAYVPYIYIEDADVRISDSEYIYANNSYTKGDHADSSSAGTESKPFEIMLYDSSVKISNFEVSTRTVGGTGSHFLLLEKCASTIHGFQSTHIQAPDANGIYVFRDNPKCVINGTECIGTSGTKNGIYVDGDGSETTEFVVITSFSMSGFDDSASDNLAIELGPNSADCLVSSGIVVGGGGATNIVDDGTNNTIDPSVLIK